MTTPSRSTERDYLRLAVGSIAAVLTELHASVMELAEMGRAFSTEVLTRTIIQGKCRLLTLHEQGQAGAEKYLASAHHKRRGLGQEVQSVYGEAAQDMVRHWESEMDAIEAAVSPEVLREASGYVKEPSPKQGTIEHLFWSQQSDVVHLGSFTAERAVRPGPQGFVFTINPDYRRAGQALYVSNGSYLQVLGVVNDVFDYDRERELKDLTKTLRDLAKQE